MIWFRSAVLLVFLSFPAVGSARWEGPADNKHAETLELLDMKGLVSEAYEVCTRRAELAATQRHDDQLDPVYFAAWDYLSVIEGVVREKSGGRLPTWIRELSFAHTTKECEEIFRSFVDGDDIRAETKPAKAGGTTAPVSPKLKPVPRPKPSAPPRKPSPPPAVPRWVEPPPRWIAPPTQAEKRTPVSQATPIPRAPQPVATLPPTPRATAYKAPTAANPAQAKRPTPDITDELPPWLMPKGR